MAIVGQENAEVSGDEDEEEGIQWVKQKLRVSNGLSTAVGGYTIVNYEGDFFEPFLFAFIIHFIDCVVVTSFKNLDPGMIVVGVESCWDYMLRFF